MSSIINNPQGAFGYTSTDALQFDRSLGFFNVKMFGARGNGVTDDTLAVTVAAQSARDNGGGVVLFPPGTFNCFNIPVYSNVYYSGFGKKITTLKVSAGSNGQIFITDNWAALFGTNAIDGPSNWAITDMTLDCNGINNPIQSWGLLIYGSNFTLRNLEIVNHRTGGILSEWTDQNTSDPLAAFLYNVNCHTSFPALGISWNGPHDSHWQDVEIVSTAAVNPSNGLTFGVKSLGTRSINCHVWGTHAWAAIVDGTATWFDQCFLEGGVTGQLLVRASQLQYHGGWILGNSTPGAKGIELGVLAGTPATACDIDTFVSLCRGGALGLINQSSNKIRLHVSRDTADPVIYGTDNNPANSDIDIQVEGVAGADEFDQIRRRMLLTNRSTPASPVLSIRGHLTQSAPLISAQTNAGLELTAIQADGSLLFSEQSDPAAPAANKAVLFARDNGAGKTQLCVRFPTGAVEVLRTEL